MIDVISTGLKDIILEASGIEALMNLNVIKDKMMEVAANMILLECMLFHVKQSKRTRILLQEFCPAVGIDEESATGTSNASLLYYIKKNDKNFDCSRTYKIEQGYFMNSPSDIYARYDEATDSIYVGGIAKIDSIETIEI